eukprot:763919-Hanusia_phi.AAC.3
MRDLPTWQVAKAQKVGTLSDPRALKVPYSTKFTARYTCWQTVPYLPQAPGSRAGPVSAASCDR